MFCKKRDDKIDGLVFCRKCRNPFHRSCWSQDERHIPSEWVTDPCLTSSCMDVHLWFAFLHSSKAIRANHNEDFLRDRSHRWLGTNEDQTSFEDYPELLLYSALTKLFTNSDPSLSSRLPRKQYPRLVSFFGDTGMGKSTIIQNLIRAFTSLEIFETPIVGTTSESHQSISGGVHVYADPKSYFSQSPIVYVGMKTSPPRNGQN
jgi:hypothetical protein